MKTEKLFFKRLLTWMIMFIVLMSTFQFTQIPVVAAPNVKITTTLVDGALQRGSKKTFDVIARDSSNKKLASQVTFNGSKLSHTWDDTDKTSYTLKFTNEGSNKVVITAGGKTISYTLNYKKANKGDVIGTATWSIDLFTIGAGYLVQPVNVNIIEGETSAQGLIRLLHENGYVGYYGGELDKAFYIAYIADGNKSGAEYNSYKNSNKVDGGPKVPKMLDLTPNKIKIPQVLVPKLKDTMNFYDEGDYEDNWKGYLGEFVFTNGSGWMYSVNNVFPNVGFADTFLSDGDVVRVQFTLGYGSDIGGASAMGGTIPGAGDNQPTGDYYKVANKDGLTKLMAGAKSKGLLTKPNVKSAYDKAMNTIQLVNASQGDVNNVYNALNSAINTSSEAKTPKNKPELPKERHNRKIPKDSIIKSDGTIVEPDGTIVKVDGTIIEPDGTVIAPNDKDIKGENELEDGNVKSGETIETPDEKETKTILGKSKTNKQWIYWCVGITILIVLIAGATYYYIRLKKNKKMDNL